MKIFLFWLIILIASIAIYGTFGLVVNEWNESDICPKILGVPACYIVLASFSLGLIGHLISGKVGKWMFFIFVGMVTVIAMTGSIGEVTGTAECPKTAGGTPMCFISLVICLSLLMLKILHLKCRKS